MLKCSACYIEVQLVKIVVVVELMGMVNGMDSVTYFPSMAGKPVTKLKKYLGERTRTSNLLSQNQHRPHFKLIYFYILIKK